MDLQGNNEFTALFRGYIRAAGVLLFAVSCVRESVKCWGGDFMGHVRLLVQGQRVDLNRASRIVAWTVPWPTVARQTTAPKSHIHQPYQ